MDPQIHVQHQHCATKPKVVEPQAHWLLLKPGSMGIPQAAMKQSTLTQLDVLREAERVKKAQELPFRRNHYELATEQDLSAQKNLQMSMVMAMYRSSNEKEKKLPLPTFPILTTPYAKQPAAAIDTQPKMTHRHHVPHRIAQLSQHVSLLAPDPQSERPP